MPRSTVFSKENKNTNHMIVTFAADAAAAVATKRAEPDYAQAQNIFYFDKHSYMVNARLAALRLYDTIAAARRVRSMRCPSTRGPKGTLC